MRFFENSMWQSGRLGFEVPDPKTKESEASNIYVTHIRRRLIGPVAGYDETESTLKDSAKKEKNWGINLYGGSTPAYKSNNCTLN